MTFVNTPLALTLVYRTKHDLICVAIHFLYNDFKRKRNMKCRVPINTPRIMLIEVHPAKQNEA
jgi:hypothetical protein